MEKYCIRAFRKALKPAVVAATIMLAIPSGYISAATSLDIMDRQRGQEIPAPLSKPQIKITDEGTVKGISRDTPFVLRSLSISGCTAYTEEELLKPYQDLIGKQVTFSQLSAIATELTKKYRNDGYLLSRFIIPEQEVNQSGANIRLHVIEGYIEKIVFGGDGSFEERFQNYFSPVEFRLVGRKPLNHRDFERYMLLMQDLPGVTISSRFEKGEQPGGSVLVIDADNQYVQGGISYGNTGTESAGPFIGSVNLAVNNLPVVGAQTSASYSQANNYREYWTVSVAEKYQMWNGLTFTASWARSDSPEMDTEFARDFDYRSNSDTFNFGVSYPIIRSRDMNLSAGLNYEHRNSDAFVLDERFTKDRLRAISGNLNFDFADAIGGVTQFIATLTHGLNIWDATNHSLEATNSLAPAEYWKIDLYASRNQQLPWNFSFFAQTEAQFSDKSPSSYSKFFLGGSRFGRGYDPGIIEGDNGFAISGEPRWTWAFAEKASLQLFGFLDWGTVWTNESVWGTPDSQSLSSAGGGIRLWGHAGPEMLPDFRSCLHKK